MKIFTHFLVWLLCSQIGIAQKEKLKGNKIVDTKQRELKEFRSLTISDEFTVILEEGSDYIAAIEADSNLHEFIQTTVTNGVLSITSDKEFTKYKKLEIRLYVPTTLSKISIHNEVQLSAVAPLKTVSLRLEAHDNSKSYLTVKADTLRTFVNHKAEVELHATVTNILYTIHDDAELKGIVMSEDLKVDLYEKGVAKLEGNVNNGTFKTAQETNFFGNKLSCQKVQLKTKNKSDVYLQVVSEILLEAEGTSEIYLLGNSPLVKINKFDGTPTLYKKEIDYNPSIFSFSFGSL